MEPVFFSTQSDFRKWFEKNHKKAAELIVGYYKVGSGKPSMTWSESVDEALCFGWIDGIRRSIDSESYCIRFTPRKPGSIWSAVNIRKMGELTAKGLMKPEGTAAFAKMKDSKPNGYSYENAAMELDPEFEREFKADKKAWDFFHSMAPSYRKTAIKWVMTAKQEATRKSRMGTLIRDCSEGRKIKPLSYGGKK